MKAMAPALWNEKNTPNLAGYFLHGWEKQFAVVRLDEDVPGYGYQVVYHEYVHSLLHTNFRWLPTWLDEGLAEFYGNTRFEESKFYVGAPSLRVNRLRNVQFIPLETLFTVNPYVFYRGKEDQIATFYAESWALVHFLVIGPEMERGKKLNQFFGLLQQGEPQVKAFQQVFGDLNELQKRLEVYINAFAFGSFVFDNSAHATHEKDYPARKLSMAETHAEMAGYRLWGHDPGEANGLVDAALKEDPNLALAHEEQGFIYFHEGKDEDAAREFSRAVELDKQRYLSQYFKTMMAARWDTAAQREELHTGLLKTVEVNPLFAPAYVQLAMLELREGRAERALAMSRKAEDLERSRAGYHLLSGNILLLLKREKEAADHARFVADRWHGPDHNEAVALWNRIPPESRPADAVVMEESEEQTKAAEGKLLAVTCRKDDKKMDVTLEEDGHPVVFRSQGRRLIGFSDTLWYGSDHFSICRHVSGMHAVIRYRPAKEKDFAGEWMALELRDDLPVPQENKEQPSKDAAGKQE